MTIALKESRAETLHYKTAYENAIGENEQLKAWIERLLEKANMPEKHDEFKKLTDELSEKYFLSMESIGFDKKEMSLVLHRAHFFME